MLFLNSLRIFQHSFWGRRQLKVSVSFSPGLWNQKNTIVIVGIISRHYTNVVCGTADTWLHPWGNRGGCNDDASTDTWFSAARICLPSLKLNSSVGYHTKNVT